MKDHPHGGQVGFVSAGRSPGSFPQHASSYGGGLGLPWVGVPSDTDTVLVRAISEMLTAYLRSTRIPTGPAFWHRTVERWPSRAAGCGGPRGCGGPPAVAGSCAALFLCSQRRIVTSSHVRAFENSKLVTCRASCAPARTQRFLRHCHSCHQAVPSRHRAVPSRTQLSAPVASLCPWSPQPRRIPRNAPILLGAKADTHGARATWEPPRRSPWQRQLILTARETCDMRDVRHAFQWPSPWFFPGRPLTWKPRRFWHCGRPGVPPSNKRGLGLAVKHWLD